MCSLDDEAPLVWDLGAVTPVGIPWKLLPGGNILGAPSPSTSHSGGGGPSPSPNAHLLVLKCLHSQASFPCQTGMAWVALAQPHGGTLHRSHFS